MYPLYTCGFVWTHVRTTVLRSAFTANYGNGRIAALCPLAVELEASLCITSAVNTVLLLRKTNINLNFLPEIRVCVEITHAYTSHSIGSAVNGNQPYRIITNWVRRVK
jgi:hypothetical protein